MSGQAVAGASPPWRARLVRQSWLLAAGLLIAMCAINRALQPNFLAPGVLASNLATFVPLMVVGAGQTYVVLGGSIDLSLGAIVSLVNVAVAVVVVCDALGGEGSLALGTGIAAGLGIGAATGLVNGLLAGPLRMQPLVATFATNIVLGGMALWVLPQAGGSLPAAYCETYGGAVLGVPVAVILLAALLLLWAALAAALTLVLRRSRLGLSLFQIGSNELAARLSGVPMTRTRIVAYGLCGLLAAAAGVLLLGYTGSVFVSAGEQYILPSIIAVVIGGTGFAGGSGGYAGTMLGTVVLTLSQSVLITLNAAASTRQVIFGLVLLGFMMLYGRENRLRA